MPAGLSTAALARFNKLFTSGVAYRTALALAADADTLGTGGGGGTGTVTAVNGKSPVAGVVTLVKGDIGLANVDNTPDATKPVSGPVTTAISAAINALVNSAPGTMDTLGEIAALLASDETTAGALATTVAGKMAKAANGSDIASPSAFRTALGLGTAATAAASSFDASGAATTAQANAIAAAAAAAAALYVPLAPTQRGLWAPTTAYALADIVIAPTGDIVTPKVAFTTGASYSAANWNILVPAAGFPGRELAAAVLATTVTLSTTGPLSTLTDTTHDINTAALDVSPTIGSRPILVEVNAAIFFGTTGSYGMRLYDKTAGTVVGQDDRATATGFQIQGPGIIRALLSPAPGVRQYGVKVNGTTGTNNYIIDGADNNCSSWIRVTER